MGSFDPNDLNKLREARKEHVGDAVWNQHYNENDFLMARHLDYCNHRMRTFVHKHLDDLDLQGIDKDIGTPYAYDIVDSFVNDLEAYNVECPDDEVKMLIVTLKETKEITKDIWNICYKAEQLHQNDQEVLLATKELAKKVLEKLNKLEPGRKLVIQGGTKEHAVIYAFTKKNNGQIDLEVINTGQGVSLFGGEAHKATWDVESGWFKTENLLFENIDSEKLNQDFFTGLLSYNTTSKGQMSDVYKQIEKKLGRGKPSTKSYPLQKKGNNCAARCMFHFISQNLKSHEKFESFSYERNLNALQSLKIHYEYNVDNKNEKLATLVETLEKITTCASIHILKFDKSKAQETQNIVNRVISWFRWDNFYNLFRFFTSPNATAKAKDKAIS